MKNKIDTYQISALKFNLIGNLVILALSFSLYYIFRSQKILSIGIEPLFIDIFFITVIPFFLLILTLIFIEFYTNYLFYQNIRIPKGTSIETIKSLIKNIADNNKLTITETRLGTIPLIHNSIYRFDVNNLNYNYKSRIFGEKRLTLSIELYKEYNNDIVIAIGPIKKKTKEIMELTQAISTIPSTIIGNNSGFGR